MKVSVLLLTMNEERNLPRCLDALSWCDDIALVDSGSTDKTVEIARARNVRVLTNPFQDFAAQRNFGLKEAGFQHPWVLHLDADEVVTPTFVQRLLALEPSDEIDAFYIPSKLMMLDQPLLHAGLYPSYQVRLGHLERLKFKQVGHGQREEMERERVGVFDEPYLHYAFSNGLKAWLKRHLEYADAEAKVLVGARRGASIRMRDLLSSDKVTRRRSLKLLSFLMPLSIKPLVRFIHVYIVRRGFLDGRAGFLYAFMLSTYDAMIAILAYEKLATKTRGPHRCALT
jgi:glycosyltransferase involved in cell wall biosynthesis